MNMIKSRWQLAVRNKISTEDHAFCCRKHYTIKRLRHIVMKKVQICLGPVILHGHFQQPHVAEKKHYVWLLKVSMQNKSRLEGYSHLSEQDGTWSFYSVVPIPPPPPRIKAKPLPVKQREEKLSDQPVY